MKFKNVFDEEIEDISVTMAFEENMKAAQVNSIYDDIMRQVEKYIETRQDMKYDPDWG